VGNPKCVALAHEAFDADDPGKVPSLAMSNIERLTRPRASANLEPIKLDAKHAPAAFV